MRAMQQRPPPQQQTAAQTGAGPRHAPTDNTRAPALEKQRGGNLKPMHAVQACLQNAQHSARSPRLRPTPANQPAKIVHVSRLDTQHMRSTAHRKHGAAAQLL